MTSYSRYAIRQTPNLSLESLALTDIILNLFIFFLITFSLAYMPKREQATPTTIAVNLPQVGHGEMIPEKTPLAITLKDEETEIVYIGNEGVPYDDLLEVARSLPPETLLRGAIVRCDQQAPIQRILETLDTLHQAGFRSVTVATRPRNDERRRRP